MKDPDLTNHEEALTRWIDDTLAPAERTAWENSLSDPVQRRAADREKLAAESIRGLLREHVPAETEPPYPDFFNSQILKRIRNEEARGAPAAGPVRAGWFGSVLRPWVPSVAAAAAVLAMLAYVNRRPAETGTRVISVYSPEPNARATAVTSTEAGAVIIDVQGLDNYPSDRQVVGRQADDAAALVASVTP